MATLTSNSDGTYTLTPTANEVVAVKRAATETQAPSPVTFMERKITSWLRDLASKQLEVDALSMRKKYNTAPASVKAEVDSLLGS